MSAALVRKGLILVDSSAKESKKLLKNSAPGWKHKNGIGKLKEKKLTVSEVRKKIKSKEEILKENIKKLELIRKVNKVNLDKETVNKIIERAVTKKPIRKPTKKSKGKKTVFTEEDFKKFEEEYFE